MKQKKIFLLGLLVFLCVGCTSVKDSSYEDLVNNIADSKINIYNHYNQGYKYYLPTGMGIYDNTDFNEIIYSSNYTYYLYVDIVSYYNRYIDTYNEDSKAYYSKAINYQDKFGYLEINKWENEKYLIEIMYNYAKIEVIVDESGIKEAVSNAMIILSSVKYNNEIIENIIGDNILQFKETDFNIFETKKTESNFLEVESNNIYVDNTTKDPDLIN